MTKSRILLIIATLFLLGGGTLGAMAIIARGNVTSAEELVVKRQTEVDAAAREAQKNPNEWNQQSLQARKAGVESAKNNVESFEAQFVQGSALAVGLLVVAIVLFVVYRRASATGPAVNAGFDVPLSET